MRFSAEWAIGAPCEPGALMRKDHEQRHQKRTKSKFVPVNEFAYKVLVLALLPTIASCGVPTIGQAYGMNIRALEFIFALRAVSGSNLVAI
ncbi:hypothetical protein NKH52_09600 [Mesorhizobium sp. M1066]|uniref:hypothetical protein n=1 Tax=unclassified Mesorhizobium TaxID=325217 RepID=UPI0033391586